MHCLRALIFVVVLVFKAAAFGSFGFARTVAVFIVLVGSLVLHCKQLVVDNAEFEQVHGNLRVKFPKLRILFKKVAVAVLQTGLYFMRHGGFLGRLISLRAVLFEGENIADVLDHRIRRWVFVGDLESVLDEVLFVLFLQQFLVVRQELIELFDVFIVLLLLR